MKQGTVRSAVPDEEDMQVCIEQAATQCRQGYEMELTLTPARTEMPLATSNLTTCRPEAPEAPATNTCRWHMLPNADPNNMRAAKGCARLRGLRHPQVLLNDPYFLAGLTLSGACL